MVGHLEAARDQRLDRFGPGVAKGLQIVNRGFESIASGIHGAEEHLVLKHEIAHYQIGVDLHRTFAARDAGENKNPVGAEKLHHVEG